tara:strand:- start:10077 stop:10259 length:183 start_codon:yes stop_codon:yes gene_type:complete
MMTGKGFRKKMWRHAGIIARESLKTFMMIVSPFSSYLKRLVGSKRVHKRKKNKSTLSKQT